MTEQVYSPLPKKSPTPPQNIAKAENIEFLDFPDALRCVIGGGKITKLEWGKPDIYVFLDGDRLRLFDGKLHDLIVSGGDLMGEDWYVI